MGLPHVCLMRMNYSSLNEDRCTPKDCIQSVWAVETVMSPALDMKHVEYKWGEQTQQTLGHTYILSSSMLPLSGSSGFRLREDFRLSSLHRTTHGRNTTVPISISEPSLFRSRHWAFLGDFSSNYAPPLRSRAPSLPSCKTAENPKMQEQKFHQVYIHFSQPMRLISKVGKKTVTRGGQKQTTERRSQQPSASHITQPPNRETLSVKGKTCLPSQPLSSGASRKELHIFLPAEGAEEEETRESESVDEGFIDELDYKISTLALQHDQKIPKQSYVAEPMLGDVVQVTL
ncbi:hypothetical protein E1301_Tti012520 [Triplophysa tibetana]|uniref:Uncharacterized protein n=1 Tax=Triplophysa tibetana TaxID=1572043 RepID=A0A5A9NNA7_9TELE|nr:hypothetical protein E1301_Tti012520 [Triplophysa tibetana]